MLRYVIKRFLLMLLTLFIIITATFFLMRTIPGGPFSTDRVLPPHVEAALNAKYHLDDPLMKQYFDYIKSVMRLDFGPSFVYFGQTVNEMMAAGLPVSARLGLLASILIVVAGITLGIIAALYRNKLPDKFILVFSTIGRVVPGFVLATLLLFFFCVKLGWFPTYGIETWKSYVLPVIALSVGPIAGISRLTRSSMLDVLNQDYVRTAHSKGLSQRRIVIVHVLRNSLIPVVTSLGVTIAALLTGSFAIEKIFAIPGLGRHFVETISNRDYTAVMGLTILASSIMIVAIFIIDMLYLIIDPRIKHYQ